MADFDIAYAPLKAFEGGYDNDPDDRGGETYAGIARNFFPKWKGWAIVDATKNRVARSKLTAELAKNAELQGYVADWYRAEWWIPLGLPSLPQDLANEIFEQAVNLGKAGCGKKLQTIINAFNYSKSTKAALFADLVVDGAIGPKTLSALATLLKSRTDSASLVHALNCMQGAHYIELAAKKASQRKYTTGWMTRTHDSEASK